MFYPEIFLIIVLQVLDF